jgi:hypothetical protein
VVEMAAPVPTTSPPSRCRAGATDAMGHHDAGFYINCHGRYRICILICYGEFPKRNCRVTAGYGIGFVLGVVVWIDEVVFIKTNGTRMTQIARIRADLGILIET